MKEMKLASLFILAFLCQSLQAETKMSERWHKLNSLIKTEIEAIQSIRPLSPRLGQRLIELHTERLELIKKQENQRFLNSSAQQRQHKSKADFFVKSRSLMKKVRSLGLRQISQFPRYIGNAEIYHTLALNSRDYGDSSETEKYLKLALKRAPSNSGVIYQIQTSLAEHYYNEKKYQTAVNFYEQVLKNNSDEWRSKHLFNASWCYLKTQNYKQAIELLIRSFKVSEQPRMVSMQDQVMDSAGAFFVMGGRIQDGLEFYLENAKRATPHLLSMAKRVEENTGFKMTEHVLESAFKEASQRQNKSDMIQVQLQKLDTYRSFKKYDRHEVTAGEINHLYKDLSQDENIPGKEDAILKITELVGYFQIRLSKNAKIEQTDYDPKLLQRIHNYFDILTDLNPQKSALYEYYKAESSFSVSRYEQAANLYKKSLEITKNKETQLKEAQFTKSELQKKVLNALLSILEYSRLGKEKLDRLALYTYSNHIALWPVDEKSRLIYKTLFNLLFEKEQFNKAKKTMHLYAHHYSQKKDRKIQRVMLTRLIDDRIENKDIEALALWIKKLNKGLFNIDQEYIEKATMILGGLLFETYKDLQDQGQTQEAMLAYNQIYEDERYPLKIKADAAFYLAQIHVEQGEYDRANHWINAYMNKATKDEQKDKLSTLYNFHITYAQGQDFTNSIALANMIVKEFCQVSFEHKEELYTNRVYFSFIQGDDAKAYRYTNHVKKCPLYESKEKNLKWQDKQLSGLISNYRKQKNWSLFLSYLKRFSKKNDFPQTQKTLNSGLFNFYWDGLMKDSNKQIRHALNVLNEAKKQTWSNQQVEEFKSIQTFHKNLPTIQAHRVKSFTVADKFNEELFNSELEKNAQKLEELGQVVDRVMATGIPEYMLISSSLLNKSYLEFADNVRSFTPQAMPQEFIKSFKMAMSQIASGLEKTALDQFNKTKNTIQANHSLSAFNYILYQEAFDAKSFNYRYMASEHVFPIDEIPRKNQRKIGQVEGGQQ